ncbi:hypothetical protein ACF073_29185 [Streptomyces sp. NPDC015171]|uniref:hypothetical protein n=1 Tax=Streptomyces sp. NPDC015171 TaxID=3364945 RepID=UPI003701744D
MGGDEWRHVGPYQRDLAAAFRREQEIELAGDDRGFPGCTVAQLWDAPEWMEYIYTGGTATVLDQALMVEPTDTEGGPYMRPLTEAEVRSWAPGGRPTHAAWTDALDSGRLAFPGRGCGNCTVLYDDAGGPAQIAYWGCTSD